MNAGELIRLLSGYEPETQVIMARDEEGNGFRTLHVVEYAAVEQDGYEYDVLHPDDEDDEEEYERAIVLWP